MNRQAFLHAVVVFFAAWTAFFIHSCGAGPPVRETARLGEIIPPPTLHVGLSRCLRDETARIAVRGPYEVRCGDKVLAEGAELPWTEVRADGGVRLGDTLYPEAPVGIIPLRDGTLEVEYRRDFRGRPSPPFLVRYHGALLVHALPDRRLALVNEIDLEDYLKGVVGKEMNLLKGVEALKTQIISARTYAVHEQRLDRLHRVKGEKFDLYDDERSQVYGGMERETALAMQLVDETRGIFLLYQDQIVKTFYSSCCGGNTEAAWEVLGEEVERIPPLAGRKCGYCERLPEHRWKEPVVFTKKEIAASCLPPNLKEAKVRSVEITRTLSGGRAREVSLTLEGYTRPVKLEANGDFRRSLSSQKLRSTLWDRIEDRGDSIAIYGRGYGHGAGMCQLGAYEMAREGKTASEILEYYFPGAKVQKLY